MATEPLIDRKPGHFVIYRKVPRGFARANRSRAGMPRFRHPTAESAETEALRLAAQHPEATFVILQERATVQGAGAGLASGVPA